MILVMQLTAFLKEISNVLLAHITQYVIKNNMAARSGTIVRQVDEKIIVFVRSPAFFLFFCNIKLSKTMIGLIRNFNIGDIG